MVVPNVGSGFGQRFCATGRSRRATTTSCVRWAAAAGRVRLASWPRRRAPVPGETHRVSREGESALCRQQMLRLDGP